MFDKILKTTDKAEDVATTESTESTTETKGVSPINAFKKISNGMGNIMVETLKNFTSKEEFASFTTDTKKAIEDNSQLVKQAETKIFSEIEKIKENVIHLDDKICDEIINSFKEILKGAK